MPVADPQIDPKRLKQAFEWAGKEHLPIQQALAIASAIWVAKIDSFRDSEEDLMVAQGSFGDEIHGHRAALSQLIAEGERIVYSAKASQLDRLPSGLSVRDLEANIESLRITLRCEHGPKNSEKVNRLVEKLFDGS